MEEGEEEEEKEVEFWETDSFNACAFAAGGEERRGGGFPVSRGGLCFCPKEEGWKNTYVRLCSA